MSEPVAPVVVSPDALRQRLGGGYALGASRELRALARLAAGEELRAVVVAVWQRRGWVVVATDVGLRLARRPRLLGRGRDRTFDWRDLTAVNCNPERVAMSFGDDEVSLAAPGPRDEFDRLVETARAHVGGHEKPSVEDIREMARRKLGRLLTYGYESDIFRLPDLLEPGERVERLAIAKLDFSGLLVLTDRQLLLLDVKLRRANERIWTLPRTSIRAAEPIEHALRLLLQHDDEVTLTDFLPPERRDEFAAVLSAIAVDEAPRW